jgi:hypothetical protein
MSPRENMIEQEARELWRALRSDAPPEHLNGSEMLHVLISQSSTLTYDRICSPFLRPTQISRPPSYP